MQRTTLFQVSLKRSLLRHQTLNYCLLKHCLFDCVVSTICSCVRGNGSHLAKAPRVSQKTGHCVRSRSRISCRRPTIARLATVLFTPIEWTLTAFIPKVYCYLCVPIHETSIATKIHIIDYLISIDQTSSEKVEVPLAMASFSPSVLLQRDTLEKS